MNADDAAGGILADDMGLGKSLTMLSAIVGTLETANSYARSEICGSQASSQRRLTSTATLIIVPFACELLY